MGYLYLGFALLAGVTKGYCGKQTGSHTKGYRGALLANAVRMLLCIIIGFLLLVFSGELSALAPKGNLFPIAALSGLATAVFVVTWLMAVRKSAYMMLDVFLMLGVLIPILASNIFFHEAIRLGQWLGIALLFGAVVLMCSYHNAIKERLSISSLLLLLLCGAANGVADFSQKLFVKTIEGGSVAAFNLYTYLFAAIVLGLLLLAPQKEKVASKGDLKRIFGYLSLMAICLFANSFFKTLAARNLPAVVLYPLNQGCALILSSLMASVLFKERLTLKAILGILLSFVALLIINLS